MIGKKIAGIISNVFSVVFMGPFSIYFGFLGLLFLSILDFSWSIINIINLCSSMLFLCTPFLCIAGIILSIIYRKKDKYKISYLVQLLPFLSVISGIFLMVVAMIWGNP